MVLKMKMKYKLNMHANALVGRALEAYNSHHHHDTVQYNIVSNAQTESYFPTFFAVRNCFLKFVNSIELAGEPTPVPAQQWG